jgi:hypothetical protein
MQGTGGPVQACLRLLHMSQNNWLTTEGSQQPQVRAK